MEEKFKAALSRSQGREGWCMIFRHPIRRGKDGQTGLRVRRGLGTTDQSVAQRLVDEMNDLLSKQEMWNPTERSKAEQIYDSRIVASFYDKITPDNRDPWAIRNGVIPLPGKDEGYARSLFLGTTGAGKTTLVRQLIGTDPKIERFPSTSAAKTTISNIELIQNKDSSYRAVVSFFDKGYLRQHIEECVLAAIMARIESGNADEVENRLLVHAEQRFRLSYVLGTSKALKITSNDDEVYDEDFEDEADGEETSTSEQQITQEERSQLLARLNEYIDRISSTADNAFAGLADTLGIPLKEATKDDIESLQELLEEDLYRREAFQEIIDDILDDVESRFDLLRTGQLHKERGGWPSHWVFETEDRVELIKTINQFSSNYAPNFGRLLTPVVEGIRVSGPFLPTWANGHEQKFVLMDGEGLGHTPDSAASISTSVTRRFQDTDAIVLVDNAAQPMQAAPTAVLRSIVSSGYHSKLVVCFTHFDEVKGDNLPNLAMRRDHVLNSFDNTVSSVGKVLGARAEKLLRECKQDRVFFLSKIQDSVSPGPKNFTYKELLRLVEAIGKTIAPPKPTKAVPIYDDTSLVLNIQKAAQEFHHSWQARLKLRSDTEIKPEHWTRVKALTRRLGELYRDEYDTLKPVADLLARLQINLYFFIENPLRWESDSVEEDMKQIALDNITRELDTRLHGFASDRLFKEKITRWYNAYDHRGLGSARTRAYEIKSIYDDVAPIPGEIPSSETNEFLHLIRKLLHDAVATGGGKLWRCKVFCVNL